MKSNKKEIIDTRPQSVLFEKPRAISRSSSTKHESKLHRPGELPGYLKKTNKETTVKIENGNHETKTVEAGDFSEKLSDKLILESKINELKLEMKNLLEENKILKENISNGILKEKEFNERSKIIKTLESQLAGSCKDYNLLNLATKKIAEDFGKEQALNKKLTEKCKNYEEENQTSKAYSEVAKKLSDKKLFKEQQKLLDSLSSTEVRCKELESNERNFNNNLKTKVTIKYRIL